MLSELTEEQITIAREYLKNHSRPTTLLPEYNLCINKPEDFEITKILATLGVKGEVFTKIERSAQGKVIGLVSTSANTIIYYDYRKELKSDSFDTNEKFIELVKQNTLPF